YGDSPASKTGTGAFASDTTVTVNRNCPSSARAAPRSSSRNLNSTFGVDVGRWVFDVSDFVLCPLSPDSPVPFRLNAFEQFGVRSIQVVSKFHGCFQSFGIHFETFSQFPGSRIVKEGKVLIDIWHN